MNNLHLFIGQKMIIKKLNEINYNEKPSITFLASLIELTNPGDGDKKPFKVLVKLEESGELLECFSWSWGILEDVKAGISTLNVYELSGDASLYKDFPQVKLTSLKDAGIISTKKVNTVVDVNLYKKEFVEIIKTYIPKSNIYYNFIEKLILTNEKFWKWPAASGMHHAYPGGLAKHTLGVMKNAINIWKSYNGENARIDTIIAGAALHDIGKLLEYNEDTTRTIYGNLIPHIISGYQYIVDTSRELGLDPNTNMDIIMLLHIILSHHEKLEWGSPVQPVILEALIIARADNLDSDMESIGKNLNNTDTSQQTQPVKSINNIKFLKWHN